MSSKPELNNPAARLLAFVQAIQQAASVIPHDQNPPVESCLYTVLGVPLKNRAMLLSAVAPLYMLPAQIRESVSRHNDMSPDVLLRWVSGVEQTLSAYHLSHPVKDFAKTFDQTTIYGITICADFLSRRAPEKTLKDETIAELSREVASLKSAILAAEMPEAVKRFILVQLDGVEKALREYALSGTVPLEQALNAAMGAMLANPDLAKQSRDSDEGKSLWKILGRIHVALGATWTTMQIGERVGQVLAQLMDGK